MMMCSFATCMLNSEYLFGRHWRQFKCITSPLTGNARALNGSEMMDMESKSGQMLGATVSVSADGKKILVRSEGFLNLY